MLLLFFVVFVVGVVMCGVDVIVCGGNVVVVV